MRYVSTFPTLIINNALDKDTPNVPGVQPLENKRTPGELFNQVEKLKRHKHALEQYSNNPEQPSRRTAYPEDRRKVSQRIRKDPVLIELRSGVDRRRRHMRATDTVVHVDEKV